MTEAAKGPVLVFLFEQPGQTHSTLTSPPLRAQCEEFLNHLSGGAASLTERWPAAPLLQVLVAAYQSGSDPGTSPTDGLLSFAFDVQGGNQSSPLTKAPACGEEPPPPAFPNPAAGFVAVADWLLRRGNNCSRVIAIHATAAPGPGSAEIERAAGMLKTAADFCGAPAWLCNLWVTETTGLGFPDEAGIGTEANPVVKSLFRMSSPLGPAGSEILDAATGASCSPAARCFEAAPSLVGGLIARFAAAALKSMCSRNGASSVEEVEIQAFLLPKDGEPIEGCQDALSVQANSGCLAISDGAGTASYSAEWARALCRQAVSRPPRFPPLAEPEAAALSARAAALKVWLEVPLRDWSPEVPWERLLRPVMYNKARAGSGATLAGIERIGPSESGGIRFRAWALGDSCVIHARDGTLLSSRPIARAAEFGYDPKLIMTRPGLEAKYAVAWQDWEVTLRAGDWLLLATDAMSEYVLRQFEAGSGEDLLSTFDDLSAKPGPEAWRAFEEFVQTRREQGTLRNDDVGLAVLRWKK